MDGALKGEKRADLEEAWGRMLKKETVIDKAKVIWDNVNPKPTIGFKKIDRSPVVELGLKFSF